MTSSDELFTNLTPIYSAGYTTNNTDSWMWINENGEPIVFQSEYRTSFINQQRLIYTEFYILIK